MSAPTPPARTERVLLALAGALGALAVGLGAYGAHGLESLLEGAPDAARRLEWWRTAVSYHLAHALALAGASVIHGRYGARSAAISGGAFALGIVLFSGTLYAMALGAPRWLGAITPIGGISLISGWLALVTVALKGPAGR